MQVSLVDLLGLIVSLDFYNYLGWAYSSIIKNQMKISRKYLRFDIFTAYDFLNSNEENFEVSIWYNSTLNDGDVLLRIPRSVNLVSI